MPIVDIELVCATETEIATAKADLLADALGDVFGSPPGRTWVRLRFLGSAAYAENRSEPQESGLPVFVTVLHAHPPAGEALAAEVRAVTHAVANGLARPFERVHVQYAPAAAGRQAFGGDLVDRRAPAK